MQKKNLHFNQPDMTIHFCSKHFLQVNLRLFEYMIMLAYENHQPTTKELQVALKLTERSIIRFRKKLINDGYLIKKGQSIFTVTDKAYKK